MLELQKKAKGERPRYFEDPAVDTLMSITLALAGEVAVLRDRIDSIERLSAAGERVTPEGVDAYAPDPDIAAKRDAWRDAFLDVVLRAVHQQREELERQAEAVPYAEALKHVETS